MKIAVDAMGGDHAPAAIVEGAVKAANEYGIDVILVGREAEVTALLSRSAPCPRITVVHAPDVVGMDDPPAQAVRRKREASLVVCAELVHAGEAAAMFSAGNTGAGMAVSLFKFGRIPGIDRPGIALPLPTLEGHTIILDAGANVDVAPHCLVQYAVMGSIYASEIFGIEAPKIGLLNIGEEETKGNEVAKEAYALLKAAPVRFVGNVEGRHLFDGTVDVAVCDGFTGNVALKTSEGIADMLLKMVRQEVERRPLLKLPALALRPIFDSIRRRTDYGERGGAPLLGVNGICIIGHGRSNARAVANAIRTAKEAVNHGVVHKIRDQLAS